MILTYKYRLKDRIARKALMRHAFGANQVWNWCVAQHRDTLDRYKRGERPRKWPSRFDLAKQCKGVGADLDIHQQTVQNVCQQWARDRSTTFRSSFGSKRARGWVPFQALSRQISGNSVTYLGKRYRFFGSRCRPLPTTAKGGCFFEDALGRWWVCFHVDVANNKAVTDARVGVDLGLKSLATTSDGEVIDNPRHVARYAALLAVAQRAGNKRREKAIQIKVAACRRDHLHKVSTRLAREYAFIAVGDVNAKRLVKTRTAKAVLDAGWSMFRTMLAYKAQRYVEVDERFTTQTCSSCGSLPPERPTGIAGLGIRAWDCSDCGASHDRDVNAARNILRLALSAQRPVEESRELAA